MHFPIANVYSTVSALKSNPVRRNKSEAQNQNFKRPSKRGDFRNFESHPLRVGKYPTILFRKNPLKVSKKRMYC